MVVSDADPHGGPARERVGGMPAAPDSKSDYRLRIRAEDLFSGGSATSAGMTRGANWKGLICAQRKR
jgi:hypothetical protein